MCDKITITEKEDTMSYEIVDKETGDRVNWAAGILAWVCVGALIACAFGRGYQEIKKHVSRNKVPSAEAVQNVR